MEIKATGEPPIFAKLASVEKRHAESDSQHTAQDCLDLARDVADQIMLQIETAEREGHTLPPPPYQIIRQALKLMIGQESIAADRRLIACYASIILGVDIP